MTALRQAVEINAGTAALAIWLAGAASLVFLIGG